MKVKLVVAGLVVFAVVGVQGGTRSLCREAAAFQAKLLEIGKGKSFYALTAKLRKSNFFAFRYVAGIKRSGSADGTEINRTVSDYGISYLVISVALTYHCGKAEIQQTG